MKCYTKVEYTPSLLSGEGPICSLPCFHTNALNFLCVFLFSGKLIILNQAILCFSFYPFDSLFSPWIWGWSCSIMIAQEASLAIPLFSPVIVPMAQRIGPLLSQIASSPTVRLGVRFKALASFYDSQNNIFEAWYFSCTYENHLPLVIGSSGLRSSYHDAFILYWLFGDMIISQNGV